MKEIRLALGLTQSEVSRRSGLTQQAISAIETGVAQPRPGTLAKLAEAFGMSPAELLEGE